LHEFAPWDIFYIGNLYTSERELWFMRLIAILMLSVLLAGSVVGWARLPEVGDHVIIDYGDTIMNTVRYNATITNITDRFYCIDGLEIYFEGRWHNIANSSNRDVCLGIPFIRIVGWA
jgi:hypothetical protein